MDRELKKTLSENLKKQLEANGLSQKDLAEGLDIRPQTVNSWIHGVSYPNEKNLSRLLSYMKCSLRELIDDPSLIPHDGYRKISDRITLMEYDKNPEIHALFDYIVALVRDNNTDKLQEFFLLMEGSVASDKADSGDRTNSE
ncbi:MAG: helix-turn-helix domain-containing protein [Lachnospiraceae bacterium]|nr:helix-turn-helix domain-containing protein [Lachnospiraceae bacterium]MBP3901100.1 helix-turn-helix domain-containing protein [Blautia sp.]